MKLKEELLLFIGGTLVFALIVAAFVRENHTEWGAYQSEFLGIAKAKIGEEKTRNIETGIRQIWNQKLNVTDRCTTCHMAIDVPGFENEKEPFRTHPHLNGWNNTHAFKDYGCTSCHGGQGFAVDLEHAHGNVEHWEYPLLSGKMAEEYGLKDAATLMQTNCNTCHRNDAPDTDRMAAINQAKKIVEARACSSCHIMDGKNGGSVGPELTFEGDKVGEAFSMKAVQGKASVLNWHIQHFKNPANVSPGSVMPVFGFTPEEERSLALLVMSWRRVSIPMEYMPNPLRKKRDFNGLDAAVESAGSEKAPSGPADASRIFQERCSACHTTDGSKKVGPSLKGIFGTRVALESGGTAPIDEAYLIESIKNPSAKVVKGFPPVMPPQNLSAGELEAMVKFIKSLR